MDKKVLRILAAVLVILLGGYFLLFANKTSTKTPATQEFQQQEIPTISAEELGLTLTSGFANKTVILTVTNTGGLKLLEYELSYTSKGNIPRGAISQIEIKNPGKPIKQEITLGTCSDVCHYDEGVSDIKLILKVTKNNGKVFQAEKTLKL